MDLKHRICPYCGKPLKLIAPMQKYLPNAVGRNNKGELFITLSERNKSYAACPSAMGGDIVGGRRHFETHHMDEDAPVGVSLVLIKDIENNLKKDSVYRSAIYQCENCMNTVAVNRNAHITATMLRKASILPPLAELAMVLFAPAMSLPVVLGITAALVVIDLLLIFSITLLNNFYDSRENNFVPVTEFDCLVELPTLLTLEVKKLPQKYRRKYNVLTTSLNGKMYSLYLTDVTGGMIRAFICGIEDEAERLISIIESRRKTEKKPLLDLYFRGKPVGGAEITAIHEIPKDYITPQTLVMPDNSVWYCKTCGYENPNTVSQCKSCGGWK